MLFTSREINEGFKERANNEEITDQ
jgi:hypothetical protein